MRTLLNKELMTQKHLSTTKKRPLREPPRCHPTTTSQHGQWQIHVKHRDTKLLMIILARKLMTTRNIISNPNPISTELECYLVASEGAKGRLLKVETPARKEYTTEESRAIKDFVEKFNRGK